MDDATWDAMEHVVGEDAMSCFPGIPTHLHNLENTLVSLCRTPPLVLDHGKKAAHWMRVNWTPELFVPYFERIYAQL